MGFVLDTISLSSAFDTRFTSVCKQQLHTRNSKDSLDDPQQIYAINHSIERLSWGEKEKTKKEKEMNHRVFYRVGVTHWGRCPRIINSRVGKTCFVLVHRVVLDISVNSSCHSMCGLSRCTRSRNYNCTNLSRRFDLTSFHLTASRTLRRRTLYSVSCIENQQSKLLWNKKFNKIEKRVIEGCLTSRKVEKWMSSTNLKSESQLRRLEFCQRLFTKTASQRIDFLKMSHVFKKTSIFLNVSLIDG